MYDGKALKDLGFFRDEIDWQMEVIEERDEEIKSIQRDVVQVDEIFKAIKDLIGEDGEELNQIEKKTLKTKNTTHEAKQELKEADRYQIRCCIL